MLRSRVRGKPHSRPRLMCSYRGRTLAVPLIGFL